MRRGLLGVSLAVAASLGFSTGAKADETLYLDTYNPVKTAEVPVTTSSPLLAGHFYVVTVSGTFSYFDSRLYTSDAFHICGMTEAHPTTPSPGRPDSQVGQDVETVFGTVRNQFTNCPTDLPRHWTNFKTNVGAGFMHYEPYASAGHTYQYLYQGQNAPASFEVDDVEYRDNNGVITINVHDFGADDCKKDGYKLIGVFKNQGDCVSYFKTNMKNPPAGAGNPKTDNAPSTVLD